MCVHAKWLQLCPNSLQPHGLQPARLLCPWDSPGKNTGVGCHAILQGIFLTQGSRLCLPQLLHCGIFFITESLGKPNSSFTPQLNYYFLPWHPYRDTVLFNYRGAAHIIFYGNSTFWSPVPATKYSWASLEKEDQTWLSWLTRSHLGPKLFCDLSLVTMLGLELFSVINDLKKKKNIETGLPWWLSGKESACQCKRHRFDPWSGKIPHAMDQLSPCATTV